MNFRSLLRALMGLGKPTPAQIRQAERVLKAAGYKVEPPQTAPSGPLITPARRGFPIKGRPATPQVEPQPASPARRVDPFEESLLAGTMFPVDSSNVHSIGMRIQSPGERKGELLVRFLAQHPEGRRSGPGSLYGYEGVPVDLFREFLHAASKGKFLWDHVRVRGTIAGHRFPYELLGVAEQFAGGRMIENYVPRQAAILRGQPGQHFIKRNFKLGEIRGGRMQFRTVGSQLRPGPASMRGPNPERGPGVNRMQLLPGRGP